MSLLTQQYELAKVQKRKRLRREKKRGGGGKRNKSFVADLVWTALGIGREREKDRKLPVRSRHVSATLCGYDFTLAPPAVQDFTLESEREREEKRKNTSPTVHFRVFTPNNFNFRIDGYSEGR